MYLPDATSGPVVGQCCIGIMLQYRWLCMQDIVAVDERGAREERALVSSYLRDLVPVLLLGQREEQLHEVVAIIGSLHLPAHRA